MTDHLAAYRRPGAVAQAAASPPPEPETYRAFATKERVARVDIRPRGDLAHAFLYSVIAEICYDRRKGTGILLMLPAGKIVKVKGRRLQPVAEALIAGTCSFIEALEPEQVDPDHPDAPVVESIEILGPKPQKA